MAQVHPQEDRNTYYLDQLFMIAICGALAGVTIMLWVASSDPNNPKGGLSFLQEQLRIWVLVGAVGLAFLILLRAIAVWRSVDVPAAPPADDHTHGHEHGPGCAHDHGGPAPMVPPPAEASAHGDSHTHGHSHSHGDGDHDHGWSPWRYVVLMLPVVLYFLVLSNPSFNREPVDPPVTAIDRITNFITVFRSILWEALPFIVLGTVIAGLLEELLPQHAIAAVLPRNRFLAICMGGVLGLIFPMCECGIVPVMRRLLRKGLPLSCCVAYLLAGPIINFVVLGSTYVAFRGMENSFADGKFTYQMGGWWMLGFRAGLGYVVAVVTGLLIDWQYRKHGDSLLTAAARPSGLPVLEDEGNGKRRSLWDRVNNVSETALHDFVDITVFLILGALLAATARQFLTTTLIADLSMEHVLLVIALMMGLAVVLCLCSEADAFVAASFVTMSPAAKLSFLVLGPMLDFKLFLLSTRIFRPRLIWTIYAAVLVQVFVYSYGAHLFWEKYKRQLIDPHRDTRPTATQAEANALGTQVTRGIGLLAAQPPGGANHLTAHVAAILLADNSNEKPPEVRFLTLEMAQHNPTQRDYYQGKRVKMTGRYLALSDRSFTLQRFRITCCGADAQSLNATMVVDPASQQKLPTKDLSNKWVTVTGRVKFLPRGTALILEPRGDKPLVGDSIEILETDPSPYEY